MTINIIFQVVEHCAILNFNLIMILKGEMSYKKVFESTLFKKTLDMGDFSLNGDSLNTLYITKAIF